MDLSNVMIDWKNVFDQPVKNYQITHDIVRKIDIGQGIDYTIGCLLHFVYFNL